MYIRNMDPLKVNTALPKHNIKHKILEPKHITFQRWFKILEDHRV